MPDALAQIAEKIKRCIRLLSSDSDGEVLAAARALIRTLKGAQLDIHALADAVGGSNGRRMFSEEDAKEIYFRGVADGRREAEAERGEPTFHNVRTHDEPSWHDIAVECSKRPDRMYGEHEKQFVQKMIRKTVHGGEPSPKEGAWLRKIYTRVHR